MSDSPEPGTRTPEVVWGLINQKLLNAKLEEISEEMHTKLVADKAAAHDEGRKRGNSGFYPADRVRREERRADEWAETMYQASLEVWETQGLKLCRAFYDAVYDNLLAPLFAIRNSTVAHDMSTEEQRMRVPGHYQGARHAFALAMTKLSRRWRRKMDVAALENEYAEQRVRKGGTAAAAGGSARIGSALTNTVGESAMEYPPDFPKQAQATVEAERLKARRQLERRRKQVPSTKYGPVMADEENLRKYILRVFRSFAKEACNLGLNGTWTVEQIRRNAQEFLRLFTIEAYYADGYDKDGRKLREMTSHWNGSVLPEVEREYHKSVEWRRYERDLLAVANVQSAKAVFTEERPSKAAVQSCAEKRRAEVDAYIREVFQKTGKRITRTDIWKEAGYKTRTEFERWERADPHPTRQNKSAEERFAQILRAKPHLK